MPIASTDQGVEIHYSPFICSLGRGQKTITKTVLNCKLQKTSNHQLFVLFSDKRSASENGNHKTIYFWNLCALQKSGTFYIKTFAVYINIESHYRLEACNFYTFDIVKLQVQVRSRSRSGSGPGHALVKVHVKVHVKVQVSSKLKIEFSES